MARRTKKVVPTFTSWLEANELHCWTMRYDAERKVHVVLVGSGTAFAWQDLPAGVYVTPEEEDEYVGPAYMGRARKHPLLFSAAAAPQP